MRSKLTLLAAAVLAALLGAEALLRLAGLPRPASMAGFLEMQEADSVFAPDPELFWRLRADNALHAANRLGLRGWLPPDAKRPRDFRIACVGDSCTFGLAVRYEEAYGMQLERLLQQRMPGRCVQAILAGLPGYSSYQSRVLYERAIAALAPDVTIVYCGAWNDYVAAIGEDDASRGRRNRSPLLALRLVQLAARAAQRDVRPYIEAFRRGETPDGRRVPLADFVANLTAMIERARSIGSTVVMIVPPATERLTRTHPVALDYRQAVREVASRHGVLILDAARLFAQRHQAVPADWRNEPAGEWPCLGDTVHPSVEGHRLLGSELAALLAEHHALVRAAAADAPPQAPAIEAVAPDPFLAISGDTAAIAGRGFAQPGAFDRVFLGAWWIQGVRVVDDRRLVLQLPRTLPPGEHAIELSTAAGAVRSEVRVRVAPPPLQAVATRVQDRLSIEIRCAGPSGWRAGVWFSTALRATPAATAFGPFALAADPDGRPPGFDDGPFRIDRLTLPQKQGVFDARGEWRFSIERDAAALSDVRELAVQGLIAEPGGSGSAVFTAAVCLALPR